LTTLGFSNATFSKSMLSPSGTRSCAIRASIVQSRPPENSTASLDSVAEHELGGAGMLKTLGLKDSYNRFSSSLTEFELGSRTCASSGSALFRKVPMRPKEFFKYAINLSAA
jgi:hypothetical protein